MQSNSNVYSSQSVYWFGSSDQIIDADAERAKTAALLTDQYQRLTFALTQTDMTGEIKRLLKLVKFELECPPVRSGMFGQNGWGPAVDSACKSAPRLGFSSDRQAAYRARFPLPVGVAA
jgi:hypothetical protein